MLMCIVCRFPCELDDAPILSGAGRCLCLGCYHRELGTTLRMPFPLRRSATALLDGIPALQWFTGAAA